MRVRKSHTGIFAFDEQVDNSGDEEIVVPEDLQSVTDEELDALEQQALEAFDALYDAGINDTEGVNTLGDLTAVIQSVRAERTRRTEERDAAARDAEALHNQIHGSNDPDDGEDDGGDEAEGADDVVAEPEPELITAATLPRQGRTVPAEPRRVTRINVPMSEIRARQPQPEVAPRLAITAASDVPRFAAGHEFGGLHELGEAFFERAKSTPIATSGITTGPKVATIRREFQHVISNETSQTDLSRILDEITHPSALVAAGGWCAPSETSYDFFNITCEDGAIDLPTMGITRGGIRFPVSPSLNDVYDGTLTNATIPWLWTEVDDILAITGSGVKPCLRVPCPTFTERRLECYGVCLTAGNLTDNAYPEATQNTLSLLQSAHYHAVNSQYIATMLALSTPVISGGFFDDGAALSSDLPSAVGWAAIDTRTRYGMCEDAILEVVLPIWAKEVMRSDFSRRTSIAVDAITDAQIADHFDVRRVRVQYVGDWQIRGTNQPGNATPVTLYPSTVQFMIYPAGTFVRGNGMTLDLGVVRDSTLNAKNDHTAAWSEECHLVARLGHQSRRYSVTICAAGRTGSANITACQTS